MNTDATNKDEVLKKAENIQEQLLNLITTEFDNLPCDGVLPCEECPLGKGPMFICDFFHLCHILKWK